MYNILIGGAAGQGVDTTAALLEKLLKRSGYHVFSVKDIMSRVRGGHNFTLLRFGPEEITSHSSKLDGILALNQETIELHKDRLKNEGFILCDSTIPAAHPNVIKLALNDTAKSLGNPRAAGSVAIGALLKLFGETLEFVDGVFTATMKPENVTINKKAVEVGYESVTSRFHPQQGTCGDWLQLTGNQSLALGAMAAGLKFYAAYPMSPSTSIMEYLAGKTQEVKLVVEQAEDEIAAINMAIGASFAGAKAMTGTSGGGFCLMVEALGLSGMAEIPLVVADIQRPGPTTGLPTRTEQSDLKFVISASQGEFPRMVIAIKNHEQAFYQTIRAFNLAEKYQIPVILLSDQYIADSSATVRPFDLTKVPVYQADSYQPDGEYLRYKITADGISPRLIPGTPLGLVTADSDEHDERGWIIESAEERIQMMNKRLRKINKLVEELEEPEFFGDEAYDTLLLGWGSTYGPIKEAVSILNSKSDRKYGALLFGDVYPLPVKKLKDMAAKASRLIDIEQNATGQFAALVREQTGICCTSSILKYDGRQLSGEEVAARILEEVAK